MLPSIGYPAPLTGPYWRGRSGYSVVTPLEHRIEGRRFSPVDGQSVLPAHGNDGSGEPAAVALRQPFGRVVVSLPVQVQLRSGERQVVQVGRESPAHGGAGSAQAGIVRFGYGLTEAAKAAGIESRLTGHSGRVGLAVELTARGASTTETMLAGGWQTARMVAHYSAGVAAEQGAVAKYL